MALHMTLTADAKPAGYRFGYARVSTNHQSLDQQIDALTKAGVDPKRIYSDKLSGMSKHEHRPGLSALLEHVRPGDMIFVVNIDRLGRSTAETATLIRDLAERDNIFVKSLTQGIDTSNLTGRALAVVLAAFAELELAYARERRDAARDARRARGQHVGRRKALNAEKAGAAQRMHASGEPVSIIAETLGVSRMTIYRLLQQQEEEKVT